MRILALLVLATLLLGSGAIVAGVVILAGVGWGFIASGSLLFGLAAVLRRGLTNGG